MAFNFDFDIKWPQNHAVEVVIWRCAECGARNQTNDARRLPMRWVKLMPDNLAFCSSECFNEHYVKLRKGEHCEPMKELSNGK
jgi:hypothetical protein